jgi:hypothetical protein
MFTQLSMRLNPLDMRIGYRNHTLEFRPDQNGERPWDIFLPQHAA